MTKSLAEIVMEIERESDTTKQVALLKQYSSKALKVVVGYAMDPGVKWLLPVGVPPYRPTTEGSDIEGQFHREAMKLIHFVDSPQGRSLKPMKREMLFLQLLESIDPADAKLLLRMKNKELSGIQMEAVKTAWPGLTKNWIK